MTNCKIRVLHTGRVHTITPWGQHQSSHVTRDCTAGKIYDAQRLLKGSTDSLGLEVLGWDCVEFVDDVGDTVTTYPWAGVEIMEG